MSQAPEADPWQVFVIGAGGLVGAAVVRSARARGWHPVPATGIRWGTDSAGTDLAAGLEQFWTSVGDRRWLVVWCAGAGVTNTSSEELDAELATLREFLQSVGSTVRGRQGGGSFVFCSSAGAVYGGASGPPFDEFSEAVPLGPYGHAKLAAEHTVAAHADTAGLSAVIARISNVYGPGQDLTKRQGLISQLCLSAITRRPLSIYVDLDTLRDYIYADDCADMLIDAGCRAAWSGGTHIKVVCSGRSLNISGVLGEFSLLKVPRPPVVMGASPHKALQGRDLRLVSRHWIDQRPQTTMAAGVYRTFEDMRRRLTAPHLAEETA